MNKLKLEFRHGLGDTVYFALQLPLYERRNHLLEVQCNRDRLIFYQAARVAADADGKGGAKIAWDHAPNPGRNRFHPVYIANKAAFNIGRPPMPVLEEKPEVLWKEFCDSKLNVASLIPPQTWQKVDNFVQSLRPPVVLVHTIGNSFQNAKSLDEQVTMDFYRNMLDGMDGSLVLLDWDNRVPRLGSYRVRHLTDDWERIDVPTLFALLFRASLLVGIDSGPMHCAHITETPSLAVFPKRHHVPASYMLPRPTLACVTPRSEPWHPNRVYRHTYNIIEDPGDEVSGVFIAEQALRMLSGAKYFSNAEIGRDVQLQHLVEDRARGKTSILTKYVDRHRGFETLLTELKRRASNPVVIETGCVRQEEDWAGAGQSTALFAAFLEHVRGRLISIDHDARHCALARDICREFSCVEIVQTDSIQYLKERTSPADLLYCDSVDTTNPNAAEHYLQEAREGARILGKHGLIAFDDTVYRARQFHGNGKFAVPWLLENGWRVMFSGYQTILSRC